MTTPEDRNDHGDSEDRNDREDRAAKFAQGPPPIPRKAIVIAVVAFAVLGLGGVVLDHFFGGPVSTTAITAGTDPPGLSTTVPTEPKSTQPTGTATSQLPASIPALLSLTKLTPTPAPMFTLTSKAGPVSLEDLRGKIVLLTFFDSRCNDICLVMATELRLAIADLGSDASQVVMLGVNTDPVATSLASSARAEAAGGLGTGAATGTANQWHFLTGTLDQLDSVWRAYGVRIEVQTSTGIVSHNNVLYFIDAKGRLRLRATPFADENTNGTFSLASSTESRFASGIASSVRSLLQPDGNS